MRKKFKNLDSDYKKKVLRHLVSINKDVELSIDDTYDRIIFKDMVDKYTSITEEPKITCALKAIDDCYFYNWYQSQTNADKMLQKYLLMDREFTRCYLRADKCVRIMIYQMVKKYYTCEAGIIDNDDIRDCLFHGTSINRIYYLQNYLRNIALMDKDSMIYSLSEDTYPLCLPNYDAITADNIHKLYYNINDSLRPEYKCNYRVLTQHFNIDKEFIQNYEKFMYDDNLRLLYIIVSYLSMHIPPNEVNILLDNKIKFLYELFKEIIDTNYMINWYKKPPFMNLVYTKDFVQIVSKSNIADSKIGDHVGYYDKFLRDRSEKYIKDHKDGFNILREADRTDLMSFVNSTPDAILYLYTLLPKRLTKELPPNYYDALRWFREILHECKYDIDLLDKDICINGIQNIIERMFYKLRPF